MSQVDYNLRMGEGQEGLITDLRPTTTISKVAEGVIGFGRALVAGTNPTLQVKIPSAKGQVFRGVSIGTWAMERNTALNAEYIDTSSVSVLRKGEIWVEVKGDVVIDAPVYYYISGAYAGYFTSVISSATELLPNAVFTSSAAGGTLATIEILMPLASQVVPTLQTFAIGQDATVTANNHVVTIADMLATDIIFVANVALTNPVYLIGITAAAGQFTVVWSGDPGASTINYQVLRV